MLLNQIETGFYKKQNNVLVIIFCSIFYTLIFNIVYWSPKSPSGECSIKSHSHSQSLVAIKNTTSQSKKVRDPCVCFSTILAVSFSASGYSTCVHTHGNWSENHSAHPVTVAGPFKLHHHCCFSQICHGYGLQIFQEIFLRNCLTSKNNVKKKDQTAYIFLTHFFCHSGTCKPEENP